MERREGREEESFTGSFFQAILAEVAKATENLAAAIAGTHDLFLPFSEEGGGEEGERE